MDFKLASTDEIARELGRRLRAQRMARLMTQQELMGRSGVSLGAIKALESTGRTTLETLVRVAQALSLTDEMAGVFQLKPHTSIAEMERAETAKRQRARRRAAP